MQLSDSQLFQIQRLFLGMNTTFAKQRGARSLCWGSGQYGKLGLENGTGSQQLQPRRINQLDEIMIQEFAAGPFHTLALTEDGRILAFGNMKDGKLGLESSLHRGSLEENIQERPVELTEAPKFYYKTKPEEFHDKYPSFTSYTTVWTLQMDQRQFRDTRVIQILCSEYNSFFLLSNGAMYVCGRNDRFLCTSNEEIFTELKENDDG